MRTERTDGLWTDSPGRLALVLACAVMLFGGPAAGTSAAPVVGPGNAEEETMPQMPLEAGILPASETLDGSLVPVPLAPVDALDKGSLVTSLPPAGAQGMPTAREAAKLDMARAAIESARLAGLFTPQPAGPDEVVAAAPGIAELKVQQMLATPSAIPQEDLPAWRTEERATDLGVPDRPAPLTPEEEAKLSRALSGSESDLGTQPDGPQGGREER